MAPPIPTTEDDGDDPLNTAIETDSDGGGGGEDGGVEMEEDLNLRAGNYGGFGVDSDSLGFRVCLRCNVGDELILNCCGTGCPITVHESCMRCDPWFDDSGRFVCPVCKQKRAAKRVERARKKVMEAKRALSIFLEFGNKENRDAGEVAAEEEAQPEASPENDAAAAESQIEGAEKQTEREEKLETETVVERPKRYKQTAGRTKRAGVRSSPRGKMTFTRTKGIARKNASGSSVHEKYSSPEKFKPPTTLYPLYKFPSEKRQRLLWTSQEEEMLRECVEQLTETHKNISWSSILEQGRHVFHSTRRPVDLRDKWRNMKSKEGSGGK